MMICITREKISRDRRGGYRISMYYCNSIMFYFLEKISLVEFCSSVHQAVQCCKIK